MIKGVVSPSLDAIVRLRVVGPSGRSELIDFVLDTGFTGAISLPYETIRRLGLRWVTEAEAILANGSKSTYDVFDGSVEWRGHRVDVAVDAADGDPLLGMDLLFDHRVTIDTIPGGPVTISPLA